MQTAVHCDPGGNPKEYNQLHQQLRELWRANMLRGGESILSPVTRSGATISRVRDFNKKRRQQPARQLVEVRAFRLPYHRYCCLYREFPTEGAQVYLCCLQEPTLDCSRKSARNPLGTCNLVFYQRILLRILLVKQALRKVRQMLNMNDKRERACFKKRTRRSVATTNNNNKSGT